MFESDGNRHSEPSSSRQESPITVNVKTQPILKAIPSERMSINLSHPVITGHCLIHNVVKYERTLPQENFSVIAFWQKLASIDIKKKTYCNICCWCLCALIVSVTSWKIEEKSCELRFIGLSPQLFR